MLLNLLVKMIAVLVTIIVILIITTIIYLQRDLFGKAPENNRTVKFASSPNYVNGKFKNFSHTPELTNGNTILGQNVVHRLTQYHQ
jgi:hypothetical protein